MSTEPDRPADDGGRDRTARNPRPDLRSAKPRSRSPHRDDEPVLPSRPEAERDEAWGDQPRSRERDAEWYREQRPPHHE